MTWFSVRCLFNEFLGPLATWRYGWEGRRVESDPVLLSF